MDLYTTSFTYHRPSPRSIRPSSSPLPSSLALPGSGVIPTIPLPNVTSATTPPGKSSSTTLTTAGQVERDWAAVQKMCLDITTREGCLVTVTKESIGVDLATSSNGSIDGTSNTNVNINGIGSGNPDSPIPSTTTWNFHLSGGYQSVMAARGAILRETPKDNRTILKVARTEILESPLATISPLKADVKRRLDEIALDSKAHIAVLNVEIPGAGVGGTILATADGQNATQSTQTEGETIISTKTNSQREGSAGPENTNGTVSTETSAAPSNPLSSDPLATIPPPNAPVTYGLETERMCELVITGPLESVEVAKVRLLVMLDELSGLHSEVCDIDYKLHNIIASRKRGVIQSIQEETATNIYYPTPLVGVLNPPQPGQQQGVGYRGLNSMGMQPTGNVGMQMTGGMGPGSTPGPPPGPHGPGNMGMNGMNGIPMGMGGMNGNFPPQQQHHHHNQHQHQHPQQQRNNAPPIYNPHQHVHYPYQPQPLHIDPSTTRGMPYNGPGMQYPMHGPPPPVSVNHTGMSSMHTGYQSIPNSRIASPMPPNIHHGMQGMNMGHGHGPGHGHGHGHGPGPGMGMGPGMNNMPYSQHGHGGHGQTHMHVGMGGGPMGPGIGMGMGQMNVGMGPNIGQYGNGPHPGLSVHGGEQGLLGKANQIWITGEFFGVQRARDMLLNVAVQKSKLVISRDTAILPRKLDWLLTERLEEVKGIMNDNGTYIQVPSVGSQASLITVFGDHRVNIERTIRSVMGLACQFYVASFWLLPISFDVLMPQATLNPAQMQPILKGIAHATGAEVVFKSNCFEMHGLEQEVRAAVMMVLELEAIHNFHHEIRFQIELANEHREFISGKKNGKINKIMKMAGVKIKFETFNDYNFLMDVSGSDLGSLQGLSMLQEELPAEVSFHVPESYHKRIIGVGGKNIQRIMKLYGVYVKFSNAEEFAALGGYIDNEDNVVARTPAKNAINLESLKQSVMELVNPKDKDYTVESVSIPRRYHRTLLGEKSIFIHDIEQKTNSVVRFPYKESASDIVTIFGPESQVHIAAAMLLDHVPFEADLHVPPNPELTRLVTSTDFILFTERVKRDHQIAIVPSAKFGQGDEAIFKFRCQRSNIDFLGTARDALEEWLGQNKIQVYPSNATKRVDSFTDAFSHFNSKLLATGANNNEAEGESLVERRQRPVTVSTDVRALFNGPGGPYRSTDDGALGFAGPLSYQNPQRGSDLWPGSAQPTRTESDHSKRDSDPIIQDRVRQASTGHSNTHPPHPHSQPRVNPAMRHQSLDISHMNFSRSLSGTSAFGPMPPSPTAANSSPNTATGPYFPHVGPHPIRANVTGRGGYGGVGNATTPDQGVEGVTQGLSNVQVSHQ
ncbi:uncharacterized protein IL334_007666 [Kwoniella shivajii]|uniref:K Homology domain-containing protein n=1 Tax=Kwoniella shivajii TaxID=564305 RepID=A0ABZ1D9T0_9TREE|nr:hypothetical protein IL334_007666 [Kwoniella shivajii]